MQAVKELVSTSEQHTKPKQTSGQPHKSVVMRLSPLRGEWLDWGCLLSWGLGYNHPWSNHPCRRSSGQTIIRFGEPSDVMRQDNHQIWWILLMMVCPDDCLHCLHWWSPTLMIVCTGDCFTYTVASTESVWLTFVEGEHWTVAFVCGPFGHWGKYLQVLIVFTLYKCWPDKSSIYTVALLQVLTLLQVR